jgi:hypothetical protein
LQLRDLTVRDVARQRRQYRAHGFECVDGAGTFHALGDRFDEFVEIVSPRLPRRFELIVIRAADDQRQLRAQMCRQLHGQPIA